MSAADKVALALKLRSYADWLDAATPKAASPAALVSTPAQDGFRYRFETSPGDAQKMRLVGARTKPPGPSGPR